MSSSSRSILDKWVQGASRLQFDGPYHQHSREEIHKVRILLFYVGNPSVPWDCNGTKYQSAEAPGTSQVLRHRQSYVWQSYVVGPELVQGEALKNARTSYAMP